MQAPSPYSDDLPCFPVKSSASSGTMEVDSGLYSTPGVMEYAKHTAIPTIAALPPAYPLTAERHDLTRSVSKARLRRENKFYNKGVCLCVCILCPCAYVCVYVCVRLYSVQCTHVCMCNVYVHSYFIYCMYVCFYVCFCDCVYVCMYVCFMYVCVV